MLFSNVDISSVDGIDVKTGKRLWEFPLPHLTHNQNMPTPLVHQGRVILGGENRGVICLLPEPADNGDWNVEQVWFQKQVALDMATCVLHGDLLFGLSHYGKGRLFCLDTATGDLVWQGPGRTAQNATFLTLPDHVVSLLDNGRLQLLEASGAGHSVVREWKVSSRPTWGPPVWLKSGLLVKDQTHLSFLKFGHAASHRQSATRRSKPGKGPSITWVNEPKPNQLPLPARTSHLTFHSELVDQDIGYCVYLPSAYDADSNRRFPVIYNLHGNGGNEFTSLDSVAVLHERIEAGRYPPMIMVLPNGGHSTFYKNSADGRFPMEDIFLKELIPFIDSEYRTIANRTGRCIEGFSMGGRGATRLAVKHPEMFCSLFCQAGNVPHLLETFDATAPSDRPGLLLGKDRATWEADDVYRLTTKNADRIRKNVRIQIACGSKDGGHIKTIRDWHQYLLETGIDHTYIELEGLAHKRTEMIERLKPIWFDYHVESLRRAASGQSLGSVD